MLIKALSLGIQDYINKTGAPGVLVGLSGGIDSAVTAALAVRALGPERVMGVRLPSRFSSQHSLEDAEALASNLGIKLQTIQIEPLVNNFRQVLSFKKSLSDQNLQARVRAVILMGLSNETGYFVLATSNKSELAMGYGTLYGDLCGALMPLGDLYKTQVWELAKAINQEKFVIPENSITKAPSAELHENQFDQDSLPAYDLLDVILERYLERDMPVKKIALETGALVEQVKQIIRQVDSCEYKRKQAPPILMVSKRVLGEARRWPVVSRNIYE
ncbi:MAG: NAD(+) synthase [Myxococcaceae bacterium]